MDGENNGKPYEQMDDLGGKNPLFLVQHPYAFPDLELGLFFVAVFFFAPRRHHPLVSR